MSAEAPVPPALNHSLGEPAGLPSVVPPSGRHILQLFLVPGLIVGAAVCLGLGFQSFFGGVKAPDEYLRGLRDPNTQVRWRAASDLAQVLPRDERLARNVSFALDLTELLQQALAENEATEQRLQGLRPKQQTGDTTKPSLTEGSEREMLDDQRRLIYFLNSALGHFQVPIGAPLLATIAMTDSPSDQQRVIEAGQPLPRQAGALWALVNLGERVQHFSELSPDLRLPIEAALEDAVRSPGDRGNWATAAKEILVTRTSNEVARALDHCAQVTDPDLRCCTAMALVFWDVPQADSLLLRLSSESWRGNESDPLLANKMKTGYQTARYQAASALAFRGSPKVEQRFDLLAEMLDEAQLRQILRTAPNGPTDLRAVQNTLSNALKSLAALHRKRPELDLSRFDAAISQLTETQLVRADAKALKAALASTNSVH